MASHAIKRCVGILREVKNKWERRTPLVPEDVRWLVDRGTRVLIQPSPKRIFTDNEFVEAGAELSDDLSPANAILGVKEFPKESLISNKTYLIFSHTIKAQAYNMPFLDEVLRRKVRLFDYECIRSHSTVRNASTGQESTTAGPRLVAFGQFAGLAGMVDGLRGLGERLLSLGFSTPFLSISSAYMYPDLASARQAVMRCAEEIRRVGLPEAMCPFTVVFTGAGNVTQGALSMFELLPHRFVTPNDLPSLKPDRHCIYAMCIDASHMVTRRGSSAAAAFDKKHYYLNPQEYEPIFHQTIAPYTSMLVNGMFWSPMYPRLLTIAQHRALQQSAKSQLRSLLAVADITCDINGSVEMLAQSTSIEQPFFVYDSIREKLSEKVEGDGVLMLGVDNLPAEFPRDASMHFSKALKPLVESIAAIDNSQPFHVGDSALGPELANAAIAADGALTPNYEYIDALRKTMASSKAPAASNLAVGSTFTPKATAPTLDTTRSSNALTRTYLLSGHLFDSGFVNLCLDLLEDHARDFAILYWNISPNRSNRVNNTSQCVIEVHFDTPEAIEKTTVALEGLTKAVSKAQATVTTLALNAGNVRIHDEHASEEGKPTQPTPNLEASHTAHINSNSNQSLGQAASASPLSSTYQQVTGAHRQRVLVLGSGFVAAPLVDHLGQEGYHVILASNMIEEARAMTGHLKHAECVTLDAHDEGALHQLVASSSLVVSLLPASLHIAVAQACLKHARHLVTASYVSPEMQTLHTAAQEKGLVFLNEIGLDPGLDHMSAMQVIELAKQRGARLDHFSSSCGGLPAPEASMNPFAYKFSWSPAGMLGAALRAARYRRHGRVVQVQPHDVLRQASVFGLNPALSLEHYPNHDSLLYESRYQLTDMDTMFRGTIRYSGTSELFRLCTLVGLLDRTALHIPNGNWRSLLITLLHSSEVENEIRTKLTKAQALPHDIERLVSALTWLGATSAATPLMAKLISPFDAFCALLSSRLSFAPDERDLVILAHEFGFKESDGTRSSLKSTLIAYGGEGMRPVALKAGGGSGLHGFSAMARTVGLPAAMGASLILRGGCSQTGVMLPTHKEIYEPILKQMRAMGLCFVEN